ncbi:MAG: rhodanese-like domain-containing protein [Bacteroidetes bacterium]|nr:rhodanese-like domain-containing protein [Bacteroidota bacterium]
MGFLSFLGLGSNKIKQALKNGAVVIDVRTANEFDSGRVPDSLNIPVDRVTVNVQRIKQMNKPVVCCCASGARSSQAVAVLKANGITETYNGGSWMNVLKLQRKL